MIFQHTLDLVLSGAKTQTRRIVKPGDELFPIDPDPAAVMRKGYSSYRKIFEVGSTYAAQPGRGKAAVARIRITDIRQEDVRCISYPDVAAEGFGRPSNEQSESRWDFLQVWTQMHDNAFKFWFDAQRVDYGYKIGRKADMCGWDQLQDVIKSRPAERYQAWALTFELVKS